MGRILHNFQCLNYKGVPTNWSFTVVKREVLCYILNFMNSWLSNFIDC